ncbi:hypothetical protein [Vibrio coralliilyticus]|uniref:hypothetical protein n=1 Tax=Vibrio coralliilyticus TaxID=190893 RepID=UPI000C16A228|nr:hypothetical protein [Vibrio coralliilyticus]
MKSYEILSELVKIELEAMAMNALGYDSSELLNDGMHLGYTYAKSSRRSKRALDVLNAIEPLIPGFKGVFWGAYDAGIGYVMTLSCPDCQKDDGLPCSAHG